MADRLPKRRGDVPNHREWNRLIPRAHAGDVGVWDLTGQAEVNDFEPEMPIAIRVTKTVPAYSTIMLATNFRPNEGHPYRFGVMVTDTRAGTPWGLYTNGSIEIDRNDGGLVAPIREDVPVLLTVNPDEPTIVGEVCGPENGELRISGGKGVGFVCLSPTNSNGQAWFVKTTNYAAYIMYGTKVTGRSGDLLGRAVVTVQKRVGTVLVDTPLKLPVYNSYEQCIEADEPAKFDGSAGVGLCVEPPATCDGSSSSSVDLCAPPDPCCFDCVYPTRATGFEPDGAINDDLTQIIDAELWVDNETLGVEERFFQVPFAQGHMSRHLVQGVTWQLACCEAYIFGRSRCAWFIRLEQESTGEQFTIRVIKTSYGFSMLFEVSQSPTLFICGPGTVTNACNGRIEVDCRQTIDAQVLQSRGGFTVSGGRDAKPLCNSSGWEVPCDCYAHAECVDEELPPTPDNLQWSFPTGGGSFQFPCIPSMIQFDPTFLGQTACPGQAQPAMAMLPAMAGPGTNMSRLIARFVDATDE